MKIRLFFVIGGILLCLILPSCRTSTDRMLDVAESYMTSCPDSSLLILSHIHPKTLAADSRRARFALLKSMALDKTYHDEVNDSLISIAVDYYSTRRDEAPKMKAWYYQGIVRKNAGAFPSAMVAFEQAKLIAEKTQDLHFLGLIFRNTATILQKSGDVPSAISNMRQALDAFVQNEEPVYAKYAKYTLACYLLDNLEFDEARMLFHELRINPSGRFMLNGVLSSLAESYVSKGDSIQSAILIYQSLIPDHMGVNDWANYALALAIIGDKTRSDSVLKSIFAKDLSQDDLVRVGFRTAAIDSMNGRYRSAYQKVYQAALAQDVWTRESLQQSLTATQRDFYKKEVTHREETIRHKNTTFALSLGLSTILFVSVILLVRSTLRRKELLIKEQMAQLVYSQRQSQRENSNLVGALFLGRMAHLCDLSSAYYETFESEYKEEYLKQFKQGLRELRKTPDLFQHLETDLNRYSSQLMERLRNQVPMTERHYQITALFFAGIPYDIIQLILGANSIESVRTTRTRIRNEIKAAAPPDEKLFLDRLIIERNRGKNKGMK